MGTTKAGEVDNGQASEVRANLTEAELRRWRRVTMSGSRDATVLVELFRARGGGMRPKEQRGRH